MFLSEFLFPQSASFHSLPFLNSIQCHTALFQINRHIKNIFKSFSFNEKRFYGQKSLPVSFPFLTISFLCNFHLFPAIVSLLFLFSVSPLCLSLFPPMDPVSSHFFSGLISFSFSHFQSNFTALASVLSSNAIERRIN